MKTTANRSFSYLIEKIDQASCSKRTKIPDFQFEVFAPSKSKSLVDEAHKMIERGSIAEVAVVAGEMSHAFALVGQKKIGNRCYLTLKNSFGANGCQAGINPKNKISGTQPDVIHCNNDGTMDVEESTFGDIAAEIGAIKP